MLSVKLADGNWVGPSVGVGPVERFGSLGQCKSRPLCQSFLAGQESDMLLVEPVPLSFLHVGADEEVRSTSFSYLSFLGFGLKGRLHIPTTVLYLMLRPRAISAYVLKAGFGFRGF